MAMNYTVDMDWTDSAEILWAKDITIGEFRFLTILGHHLCGYFVVIQNWHIYVEAGEPESSVYGNYEQLVSAGVPDKYARALSEAIADIDRGE